MPALRHFTILAIIAVAGIIFVFEQSRGTSFSIDYGAVPIVIRQAWDDLIAGSAGWPVFGELSRLFTALFLHGDVEHLIYNMVFLWTFGSLASEHLGRWCALALFVVCGACGNVLQVLLNAQSPLPIIGASGAICGFQGVYLGLALRWRLPWAEVWPLAYPVPPAQLGIFAVVGFLFDLYSLMNHSQPIAYGAHLGGFLSGLTIAALVTQFFPTTAAYQKSWRYR
jgi:membrane associated rhomboid family serine protease